MKRWIISAAFLVSLLLAAPCVSAEVTSKIDSNGIYITFQADETNVRETDRFLTVVYPPGAYTGDFSAAEACLIVAVDSVTAEEAATCVYYFDESASYGDYTAVVYRTDETGAAAIAHRNTLERINAMDFNACIEDFRNATKENFETVARLYIDTREWITVGDDLKDYNALAPYFILAREGYEKGVWDGAFHTIEDTNHIVSCFEAARVLLALQQGTAEDVKIYGERYGSRLGGLLDSDIDFEVFSRWYRPAADETAENISGSIRLALTAGKLYHASRADIAAVLTENAALLGIDMEYLAARNVTMSEIAPYIDNTLPGSYLEQLAQEVRRIADEIVSDRGKNTDKGGGHQSSSGGGSGVVALPPAVLPPEVNKQEPNLHPENDTLPFTDLQEYEWARESITELYAANVIEGLGDGRFCPGETVKREEFIKMLISAAGIETLEQTDPVFEDCRSGDWFFPYVEAAFRAGITNGISRGVFGTGQNITRQDMAVMCANVLRYYKRSLVCSEEASFTDADEIADYALEAVCALTEKKIFTGFDDGSFQGEQFATRAQSAVILSRMMNLLEGE